MKTYEEYATMTDNEIKDRVSELGEELLYMLPIDEKWDVTYKEYTILNAILDERYREENQDKFNAFYEEHIKGKSWEEIDDETWSFYSDWHKDMYGYRPRSI